MVSIDECHSLDGEEGGALQRIMRIVECPFLALSATIGNGAALASFWSSVRGNHRDCIAALVSAEAAAAGTAEIEVRDPEVHLEVHEGRFINLQRLTLKPSRAGAAEARVAKAAMDKGEEPPFTKVEFVASKVELEPLHPLAAVDLAQLRELGFKQLSISFTPRDTFATWKALEKHCGGSQAASIAHLEPEKFFSQFGDPSCYQVTLAQAKSYEVAMKTHLEAMAQDDAATLPQLEKVLQEFKVDEASLGSAGVQLFNFAIKCRDEQLFPCLCFQLDSFKCLELYKELLGTLESKQRVEFPNYYKDLEEKAAAERKKAVDAAKAAGSAAKGKKGKDDEDGGGGADEVPDDALLETFIDTAAPHPSYVLSPPTARISTVEFDDILDEMKRDKEPLPPNHPLARGLRRGLGIYIEDVGMTVYRRVVQRLAQQGKLAVVFSDHSLAYGVNMPFRTCAFCGDMGGLLTPLMAQQMSGRTGRRGLDTQGNIVYLGMPWGDIKGLIRGRIPAIEGEKQLYPTMALQPALSDFVDTRMARNAARPPFARIQAVGEAEAAKEFGDYFEISSQLMQELGLLDEDNAPALGFTALTTCWELRETIAEALHVTHCLPLFMKDFVEQKPMDYAEKVNVQVDFFAKLLHFIGRQAPYRGVEGLPETALGDHRFVTKYPERQASWDEWEAHLAKFGAKVDALPADLKAQLAKCGALEALELPVKLGDPIDATVFTCLLQNKLPLELPSTVKYDIKKRMFALGTTVIKMHNCLCQPGEFQGLEPLLRKCFARLKYVLTDAIRNETSLQDVSGTELSPEAAAEVARLEALAAAMAADPSAGDASGAAEEGAVETVEDGVADLRIS